MEKAEEKRDPTVALPSRPYRIALTGGSGSGKGAVAGILAEKGIACLDTDAVVHRLYEEGEGASSLPRKLAEIFGESILRDGKVYRPALREIVFSDRESLTRLNRIVHAAVREECARFFEREAAKGSLYAAVDAPQLFEAGMEGDYHLIVAVDAPETSRIARIMQRDGISEEAARRRLENQLPPEEYRKRADLVLENTGDLSALRVAVTSLLQEIEELNAVKRANSSV